MPTRIVFDDGKNNMLECWLNAQGKVYIHTHQSDDEPSYGNEIVLDKSEVDEFIKVLQDLRKRMDEGGFEEEVEEKVKEKLTVQH